MSLKARVEAAIDMAEHGQSRLPKAVLELEGMSSPKVRHFLSNVTAFPDTRYLEIGCYKGSTLIAALYGKDIKHWAIDNFCEYHSSEELLRSRCAAHGVQPNFFNADCFSLDLDAAGIRDVNVYFYDGWHSFGAQVEALGHFIDRMEKPQFIYIVDDWGGTEGEPVRNGTKTAIQVLNLNVIYERALPGYEGGWWNGLWVGVLSR